LIGGQRFLIAAASFRPSIDPRHLDIREDDGDVHAHDGVFEALLQKPGQIEPPMPAAVEAASASGTGL
jgi:hypothetical protein